MRVTRNAVLGCKSGVASPDGRFVIFGLGAAIGIGHDLWVLDTASGSHRLLYPNISSECPQVLWTGDRATLSLGDKVVCLDLAELKCRVVDILNRLEVEQ